ncbi:-Telomerase Cajal body protein 1 [Babesia bigemina]|uniref:-Telomerase Cajal body protein 1 n=1 Tax=Babesia bigemina TaxID=5866 RepID=A0A061DDN6_BABBI|nr:-Telomerase Cajal body protein 1 [Babesia bigemina]CDR97569.1 -Telomerase Cajal body protein 1 [Babesia bigemina]|eukprot:XP_012769755.1 -Telomerase Cajal body protein 1 [Babesia bigemina]
MHLSLCCNTLLNPAVIGDSNEDAYVKSAQFSPDGAVFLAIFNDSRLSIYHTPEVDHREDKNIPDYAPATVSSMLELRCNDDIRGACFFPNFNYAVPDSCCLLIASRGNPVHLHDTQTGKRHFTYKPISRQEELVETYSLDFHPLGKYFIAGSRGTIHIFDIESPGSDIEASETPTQGVRKIYAKIGGTFGIVSSISHNPHAYNVYACGDYNSLIGVFDHNISRHESLTKPFTDSERQMGPITHLRWLNEHILLEGGRTDAYVRAFDIRGTSNAPIMRCKRTVVNNQKVTFDIKDGALVSGTSNGDVVAYETATAECQMVTKISANPVTSAQFHPTLPLLLTASGTRTFQSYKGDIDSDTDTISDSTVKLWFVSTDSQT